MYNKNENHLTNEEMAHRRDIEKARVSYDFINKSIENNINIIEKLKAERLKKKNENKKEEPEVKKVKKSELKKIIKKAFEDEVISKKKYETLMEQYSDKEYEKIVSYINNNYKILNYI